MNDVQSPTPLSEEDIRPGKLLDNQRTAVQIDIERMLSRSGEFVDVPCPACDSRQNRFKFEKNGIRYVDCEACETFFVNPRPAPHVLDWFYAGSANYEYWNKVIFPASEGARREKIFVPRVNRLLDVCARLGVHTGKLIEIGAGFGTFCEELASRRIFERIVAVEPTPALAATCRNRGLEVFEQPIEHVRLGEDEKFDVAVSFEVIEHLFNPAAFLTGAAEALQPGGLLVLTCPNGKGFDVETLGPLSNTVDHEHLNYFHPASLSALIERCGFDAIESLTPGRLDAELVRNQILSGTYDVSHQPFLKKVLIDEWDGLGGPFQQFLVDNGLSSNMWVIARKRVSR